MMREIRLIMIKTAAALVMTVVVFTVFKAADSQFSISSDASTGSFEVTVPDKKEKADSEKETPDEPMEDAELNETEEILMIDISADISFDTGEVQMPSAEVESRFSPVGLPVIKKSTAPVQQLKGTEGIFELKDVDKKPKLISRVKPVYPPYALKSEIEGKVFVKLRLSVSGSVISAEILRADPPGIFEQSALEAVRQWKFSPASKDDKKVSVWGVIVPISFLLQR